MAFTTAIGFLFGGVSLLALGQDRRRIAGWLGLATLAMGAGTLAIYWSADALGWERFVYNQARPVFSAGVRFDGRMSPNAAVAFALWGASLLLMARDRWRPRWLTFCSALLLAIAGLALLGYAVNLKVVGAWWRYTGMAIHTAMGLLLAGFVPLVWVRRRGAIDEKRDIQMLPFFAIATTMLLVIVLVVVVSSEERDESERRARRSLGLQMELERFNGAMARRLTATQNFILTGDDYYLARMGLHRTAARTALDEMDRLTPDSPNQRQRVLVLQTLAARIFSLKDTQASLRRTGGIEAATAAFRAEPKDLNQSLRDTLDAMLNEEALRSASWEEAARRNERRLSLVLLVSAGGTVALLAAAFALVLRSKRRLREANEVLERRVAERTGDVERAAAAAREVEDRFRRAMVDSPVPAMLWAGDGRLLLVNRSWLEQSGYAPGELQSLQDWTQRALGRLPPANLPMYLDQRFADESRVHDGQKTIRTKQGETRVWDFHTASIGSMPDGVRLLVSTAVDLTLRLEAEADLRDSEQSYRFLADVMPQIVWTTSADGQVDSFNRGWLDYTGRTLADSRANGWAGMLHPDDAASCLAEWEEMLAEGRSGGGEYRLRRAEDGAYRWHLWRAHPQRERWGKIERWVGTSTDIHEQKLLAAKLEQRVERRTADLAVAQANLAESNRLQRAVLDGNSFGIIATGSDGIIQVFSRGAEQMLGYTAAEMVGQVSPLAVHRPDELVTRARELSHELGRTVEPGFEVLFAWARLDRADDREWTYVRKDGTQLPVQVSVTALRGEDGAVTGFLAIARDLTQRRAAEAVARESEERVRLFAEHAPASVAMFDREMRYLVASRRWQDEHDLAGMTSMGQSLYELSPGSRARWEQIHQRVFAGAVESNEADRFERADGTVQWLRWEVRPWRDRTGEVGGLLMFTADITERKRLEESLAVARDEALAAVRVKSNFLANMSHEIRTPMNAILGMGEMLADTPLSDAQREIARTLQNGAECLLAIIDDILDYSKIEAGKLRLEQKDFEFRKIIADTVALFAPQAQEKGIELTQDFDATVPQQMVGDAGRVRQVFANVLNNAIKFTEHGEIGVVVRCRRVTAQRAIVRVSVTDTGRGISDEAQSRLFQPFMQGDSTVTRRFGGTGLGLAIARELLQLMGGEIGFESVVGRGSTFWFEVHFAVSTGVTAEPLAVLPAGKRVLVVDGGGASRRIIVGQLEQAGLFAEAVADGAAALERLRAGWPWDVVLLDWHLPRMNGLEVAIEIRADPLIGGVPLVMLSAAGPVPDAGTATAVGFAAFLMKPVNDGQLLRCLERVLRESAVARPQTDGRRTTEVRRLKILLAEDNPANQRVANLMLAKLGHSVDLAANGRQAVEQLGRRVYDVVLMDCQMPVLDGYETTRLIREGGLPNVNARVPIIALTAYATTADRAKCLEAGMDDHVTKPLRFADLRAALARVGIVRDSAPSTLSRAAQSAGLRQPEGVLDPEVIETVRALPGLKTRSLLPELIEMYLSSESDRLGRMRQLAAERAEDDLAHEAHGFASNAASFGATRVPGVAFALERAARGGDWAAASARLDELRDACEELHGAIRRLNLA